MKPFAIALLCVALAIPSLSKAAPSDDECAIWLCLIMGFTPDGCSKSKTARLKRIIKFESPIPSFGSCDKDGDDGGMAANSFVFGLFPENLYIDMNEACIPPFNEIPGCVPYTITSVTQDGEQVGEMYMQPFDPESGMPGFSVSEYQGYLCELFPEGSRHNPELTDEACDLLLAEQVQERCTFLPENDRIDPLLTDEFCETVLAEDPIELEDASPDVQAVLCTYTAFEDRANPELTDEYCDQLLAEQPLVMPEIPPVSDMRLALCLYVQEADRADPELTDEHCTVLLSESL